KETAQEQQLAFRRVATSGTDPRFVAALADIVQEHLDPSRERIAVTELDAVDDVCGHNCCQVSAARAVPAEQDVDTREQIAAHLLEQEGAGAGATACRRPARPCTSAPAPPDSPWRTRGGWATRGCPARGTPSRRCA